MENSVDPDQMASLEAIWSGSTLFSKAMPILVQQDKGQVDKVNLVPCNSIMTVQAFFILTWLWRKINPCPADPG